MCIIKTNGIILPLSDVVSVGIYKFEEYEILKSAQHKDVIVGHEYGEKPFETKLPIKPTGTVTISDRGVFDSLMILASKALPVFRKDSDKQVLSWCKKYGLPFCSIEASQQVGYLACPLWEFYNFLFSLRDAFWKVESLYEDFSVEHGIDNVHFFTRNPYREQDHYFTKERKQSLISEFINAADLGLCFEYRNGKPTFYNYAKSMISLTRYQFALILLSNSESVPRRCKCCGSMFFAHRKNQLYGPCCTRQKRYAAEKRKKEREEGLKKHG